MGVLGDEGDGRGALASAAQLWRRAPLILRPRVHAALVTASAAGWLAIAVVSLVPGRDRPHTGFSGNLEHATAYAIVAALTRLCLFGLSSRAQLAGFSLAAALFEIGQIWIPGRSAGVDNWLASTGGALLGLLAARWLVHRSTSQRALRGYGRGPRRG